MPPVRQRHTSIQEFLSYRKDAFFCSAKDTSQSARAAAHKPQYTQPANRQEAKKAVKEQLKRSPKMLPQVAINTSVRDIFGFTREDFQLSEYNPHPKITIPVAL